MIESIKLINWKSHLNTELEFSKGVNCLVGLMGSGKTSILEAISFVLFGTFPSLQSKRISLNDLIMKRPQMKKNAEVILNIRIGDNLYSVNRKIERGKGTVEATVRENGRIMDVGSKGVSSIITNIMDMDYDLFSKAVYSEQNMLDFFLRIPRGKRMQTIDRMLKLNIYEDVRERIVSMNNRINNRISEKIKIVSDMESENMLGRLEKLFKEINDKRNEYETITNELKIVLDRKNSHVKQLENYEGLEKKIRNMEIKFERNSSIFREILLSINEKRKGVKEKGYDELKNELNSTNKNIDVLNKSIEKKQKEILRLRERIGSLTAMIRNIEKSLDELRNIKAKCPVCESDLDEKKKNELIRSRVSEETESKIEIEKIAKEIQDSEKFIEKSKAKVEDLRIRRDSLKESIISIKEISQLEKRKEEYSINLKDLRNEMKELKKDYDEDRVNEIKEALKEIIAKESEMKTKCKSLIELTEEKEKVYSDLKKRFEMLEKYKSSVEIDRKVCDQLSRFKGVLMMSQLQLRDEFLNNVNSALHVVWTELYPYQDYKDIRLSVDKDYVLEVRESSGWVSVEGLVSGGERSMACLALRIAFSLTFIPNLRWLILDEPTHNLDINAINQFIHILNERMEVFSEQVFIITHEERISEGLVGNLYKFERNKAIDEPTRVIRL